MACFTCFLNSVQNLKNGGHNSFNINLINGGYNYDTRKMV